MLHFLRQRQSMLAYQKYAKRYFFICQTLPFLDVEVKYPIIVQVDNVGAIYMMKNNDGKCTKHIDIRYHFMREYMEENINEKIVFKKNLLYSNYLH